MTHIKQRIDTAAGWVAENPVLMVGEVGWETNGSEPPKPKVGDGFNVWTVLPYATADISVSAEDVGLGQVDNTSDLDKPVSSATQAALDFKAPKASPAFTGNPTAPTPSAGDNDTSLATTAFVRAAVVAAMLEMNPVGSIKMTANNVNPGTYLGGTWAAWGSGRVPVGVDAGQVEFDTAEETGGAKTVALTTAEMPAHSHQMSGDGVILLTATGDASGGTTENAGSSVAQGLGAGRFNHPVNVVAEATSIVGSGSAHNNLQPYITCFMWKSVS